MPLLRYVASVFIGLFFAICPVDATFYVPASCCEFTSLNAIRELLRNAAPHDARLLLNLLYWSHERSRSTLLTQAAAGKNLYEQWNAWQSCADRRLNPQAVAAPFHEHEHHKIFEALDRQFHITHSRYSAMVTLATDSCYYEHKPMVYFVESLREQARQHVMHTIQQQLSIMAQELDQQLAAQAAAMRDGPGLSDQRGLITYLINQLAVASFVQLDASWRLTSNQLMLQFLHIQGLFNGLWETIETARAAFYRTYFTLVHTAMTELKFPVSSFMNVVQLPGEAAPAVFALSIE